MDIRDRHDKRIGHFDGIIFDPGAGRVRYLVLDTPGLFKHSRYLIPIDPTQIDAQHHSLRVGIDSEDLGHCTNFDPKSYPEFSDDDLIDALFARPGQSSEVH